MRVLDTGIVHRNPIPHVWSRHAYFPSLADLGGGELVCSMVIGQAFESEDCRLHLARSVDYGKTWTYEGRMFPERDEPAHYFEAGRLTRMSDGSLVAVVCIADKHRREEGLSNPETLGFVETRIVLHRSLDAGRTWSGAVPVEPPLIGPEFELCSPIVELRDGRWLYPCSTWKAWDGSNPTGMKAVCLISDDRGQSWPRHSVTFNSAPRGIINWESKVIEVAPGRLVGVAWAYDEIGQRSLRNACVTSDDGGVTFSAIAQTDLQGETAALIGLGPDRVLCVYRRTDVAGLYAADVSLAGGQWSTQRQVPLYDANSLYGTSDENQSHKFTVLRFGAPCVIRLETGELVVAFWCVEDCVSNIRWVKLAVE